MIQKFSATPSGSVREISDLKYGVEMKTEVTLVNIWKYQLVLMQLCSLNCCLRSKFKLKLLLTDNFQKYLAEANVDLKGTHFHLKSQMLFAIETKHRKKQSTKSKKYQQKPPKL